MHAVMVLSSKNASSVVRMLPYLPIIDPLSFRDMSLVAVDDDTSRVRARITSRGGASDNLAGAD